MHPTPLQSQSAPDVTPPQLAPAPVSPSAAARPRSLWRNRDFVLLWSGQAVSTAGTRMTDLALPLLILALTGSAVQAGLAAAFGAVPRALFALPAGALVDRWDRKRVMIACDVVRVVALGSVPLALALHRLTMPQLYLVAFVQGSCAIFFIIARASALPRVVPREQLPAAVARNEAAESLVGLAGPPLAGALYGLGRALPFLTDAVSYAVSALSLRYIRVPFQAERAASAPAPGPRRLWADMGEGLAWLWRAPLMRFMAFIYAGIALFINGAQLAWLVLALQRGATPFIIGLLFAAGGAGGLLGVLVGPYIQRHYRFGQVLPVLQWVYALYLLVFAVVPNFFVMALAEAASMVSDQIYDVVWPSYRMALIPDALQGRVTSAFRLSLSIPLPIGSALCGVLIQRIGAAPTLLIAGAGLSLLALAVTLNPHVRHAPPVHNS